MSRNISDSFLPSGGLDSSLRAFSPPPGTRRPGTLSPVQSEPLDLASMTPSTNASATKSRERAHLGTSSAPLPRSNSHNRHFNHHPPSPPKTRSTSADHNTNAKLVEDYRAYTQKIRDQFEGERAHMAADRARADECFRGERELWELERATFKARIAELEEALRTTRFQGERAPLTKSSLDASLARFKSLDLSAARVPMSDASSRSPSKVDNDLCAAESPFYVPGATLARPVFETMTSDGLRVNDMPVPGDDPLVVTSKVFTAADFIRSPSDETPAVPATPTESIDISRIQPDLDGIPIRTSAVNSDFVAMVMSPVWSPNKLSPTSVPAKPGPRNASDSSSPREDRKENKPKSLEVAGQPADRRLTLHAGHTPNHSLSVSDFQGAVEAGELTPRQITLHQPCIASTDGSADVVAEAPPTVASPAIVLSNGHDGTRSADVDKALTGRLALPTKDEENNVMLEELDSRLEELRKSQNNSPRLSPNGVGSAALSPRSDEEDSDDHKPLKLKASINFGRPMGAF